MGCHCVYMQQLPRKILRKWRRLFSPVVKWLSPLTLNQVSSVRIRAGEGHNLTPITWGSYAEILFNQLSLTNVDAHTYVTTGHILLIEAIQE